MQGHLFKDSCKSVENKYFRKTDMVLTKKLSNQYQSIIFMNQKSIRLAKFKI